MSILLKDDIIENQIDPCSEEVNQPALATYQTISPHPRKDAKTEREKSEEYNYDVLNRENLGTTMDPEIIHEETEMINYSKLELTDKEIKPEKNPAYATTTLIV